MKKSVFLAACVLLAACTTDVYEPKPDPEPTPNPTPGTSTSGIPDDFDFSTVTSKQLTVNVSDEYDGKYYYTVEVLNANPIMNENAKVLIGGKTNKNKPFNVELVCPKDLKELFIRQIDPYGLKKIWSFEIKEGDIICDLKPASAPDAKSVSLLRADYNFDLENGVSFDSSGAISVSNENGLNKGGKYVIPKGSTLSISKKDIDGVKLYVEGILEINNELELSNKSEIYIASTGSIIGKNNNDEKGKLTCENGSRIFNSGTIDLNKVDLEENDSNYDCVIFNIGEINLKELEIDGSRIFNYCLINVANRIDLEDASSSIYNKKGAILCKHIFADVTSNIYMYAKSLFVAEEQVELNKDVTLTIYGENGLTSADYALFKTKILNNKKGLFQYFWGVEISVEKILGKGNFNGVSEGQPTTVIDKSSCNNNTGNDPDKEEPDTDPGYQEKDTPSYTYMFEDNWPAFGDYDMNDLVMDVNIVNTLNGENNAVKIKITSTIRAVGATKDIYAFAQIEAPGANNLIVPLLDAKEAHMALAGVDKSTMLNTYTYTCDPVEYTVEVDMSGVKGYVNAKNLNVFIVWGDPNIAKRNEVHLPKFNGTIYAAPTGKKGYSYDGTVEGANSDYDNMMWGLMVPTDNFASYPKETVKIFDAYPDFFNWASTGGNSEVEGWYTYGNADKLYQGQVSEPKK